MARRRRYQLRLTRRKLIIIVCAVLAVAIAAGIFIWISYNRQLRIDMDRYLESTLDQIEQGEYELALEDAEQALTAAYRLREYELADLADAYIRLINTLFHGDRFFKEGNYEEALDTYIFATLLASDIPGLGTDLISKKIISTEKYIAFYALVEHADRIVEISGYDSTQLSYVERLTLYKTVISIYEDAKSVAVSLSFADGIVIAESGTAEVYELINRTKRAEAMNLFFLGNQLLNDGDYILAHEAYVGSMELFIELDDILAINNAKERIDFIETWLLNTDEEEPASVDDEQDETGSTGEPASNYEFNLSINFDLDTLIDNQNQRPANQIRMGSRDGRNEGWYNGCGWVATYNALLLMDNPKHPAEIVRYFEESGGTVLDGVYGTYPNAIEDYIKSFGFTVNRTTFPQLTLDIDEVIKSSRVSILTYAHTTAAHYVAIEYRADIDKFIVYNDSFARSRSTNLGFSDSTNAGAAIDSVAALINNTREILFSFSLITVK